MTGNPTDMHDSGMTQAEASALFQLRCNWGGDYEISWIGGIWVALRREFDGHQEPDSLMLRTKSPEELNAAMLDDLRRWLDDTPDSDGMYRKLEQMLQEARSKGLKVSVTSDEFGKHHLEVMAR
jgi:hypothetical protein